MRCCGVVHPSLPSIPATQPSQPSSKHTTPTTPSLLPPHHLNARHSTVSLVSTRTLLAILEFSPFAPCIRPRTLLFGRAGVRMIFGTCGFVSPLPNPWATDRKRRPATRLPTFRVVALHMTLRLRSSWSLGQFSNPRLRTGHHRIANNAATIPQGPEGCPVHQPNASSPRRQRSDRVGLSSASQPVRQGS